MQQLYEHHTSDKLQSEWDDQRLKAGGGGRSFGSLSPKLTTFTNETPAMPLTCIYIYKTFITSAKFHVDLYITFSVAQGQVAL